MRMSAVLVLVACAGCEPPRERRDAGPVDGRDAGGEGEDDAGEVRPVDERFRRCETIVEYRRGQPAASVEVAGGWDGFSGRTRLTDPDGDGLYSAALALDPGLYPYKLVVDGNWILDPSHRYRAYQDGVENSGLRVPDCRTPLVELVERSGTIAGDGRGSVQFRLRYREGADGPGPDAGAFAIELRSGSESRPVDGTRLDPETWELTVSLDGLADGKHTVAVTGASLSGARSNTVLLPFWVEPEAFDWKDALIYMIVTDRFRNGDPANDPSPTAGAVASADFEGGDLQGVAQAIEDGTLDALGVRALWLTPWVQNPTEAFFDGDGLHLVTGFHGYWPIDPRRVDPRFGGEQALQDLVRTAHQHGIRVLMDFVINHVHEQHPYVREHPEWFHTIESGCRCGTDGCDWTVRRLDCLFHPYMPDVAWENNDASEAFLADALWWLETFDLDGLRVDAVKHVPDGAIFNLGTRVTETFEQAGTNYFLMGETAMGWYDCDPVDPTCNAENYDTISRYVGADALDGQFDFVLFHGAALRVFAHDERGLVHADVWTEASRLRYPAGAIMTPYVGSHDTSRFVSNVSHPQLSGNKWPEQELPSQPDDDEPYRRLGLALTWNLTIPGAPLLYYGDEYGEPGAADPDNRHMIRLPHEWSAREQDLDDWVSAVGRARRELPALRRGDMRTLLRTEETWAYLRTVATTSQHAIVALNKSPDAATLGLTLPAEVGWSQGTVLVDRIRGGTVTVGAGGALEVPLEAFDAAILTPQR